MLLSVNMRLLYVLLFFNSIPYLAAAPLLPSLHEYMCVATLTRIFQVEQFIAATQLDQYLAVAYVVSVSLSRSACFISKRYQRRSRRQGPMPSSHMAVAATLVRKGRHLRPCILVRVADQPIIQH